MKKILAVVLVLVILGAGAFLGLRLFNTCDSCGESYFGTGYAPNVLYEAFTENTEDICEECAELNHVLEIGLGSKTLDDYKLPLFK